MKKKYFLLFLHFFLSSNEITSFIDKIKKNNQELIDNKELKKRFFNNNIKRSVIFFLNLQYQESVNQERSLDIESIEKISNTKIYKDQRQRETWYDLLGDEYISDHVKACSSDFNMK